jgi:uncharacterized protein YutE (UPF0331/DUF86 family)
LVDEAVVRARLGTLRQNTRRLQSVIGAGRPQFVQDENLFLKGERCLQLCIQAILDIGTHVVAAETLERPAGYEDVVPALGRAGILQSGLVDRLVGIAGLRNILVHDYLAIDLGLLYDNVERGLRDFAEFATAIEEFLAH